MYDSGDIVLISFPFSYLKITKIRPALVITQIKEDIISLGIFSKIPDSLEKSWVFLDEEKDWFKQTGLKKKLLKKTEKIAVIHSSLVKKKIFKKPGALGGFTPLEIKETTDKIIIYLLKTIFGRSLFLTGFT
tara:strand:+ start:529 stop:924 length:396 start_codon:yes stop_codon:yes gene_type:complete